MRHVQQIQELADSGQFQDAYDALDNLLHLGPTNTQALKLKAHLLEHEGFFDRAEAVWQEVYRVDPEDGEVVDYFMRRHLEDREHFFFTDDLPNGTRRFLAYPRAVINASMLGLIGSLVFLVTARFLEGHSALASSGASFAAFLACVILPWAWIVASYLRSLRYIAIGKSGVTMSTRLRTVDIDWEHVDRVCLAYSPDFSVERLSLVIIPKDTKATVLDIDLSEHSSGIRARSYLIRELTHAFSAPESLRRDALNAVLADRPIVRV